MSDPRRLSVILGASRGIGRHLAQRAAANGDALFLAARDKASLEQLALELRDSAAGITVVGADVLAGEGLTGVGSALADHQGPSTVFVTAARLGPAGRMADIDPAAWGAWGEALTANVVGTARILQTIAEHMKSDGLAVVFSGGGVGGPNPQSRVSSYTTSKTAICHIVEVLARESTASQEPGPCVVAVAPGAFPTDLTRHLLEAPIAIIGDELHAEIIRTQNAEFDATDLDALLDYLESSDVRWLSGSTLSARWETPSRLDSIRSAGADIRDLFRLRRIDGDAVVANKW